MRGQLAPDVYRHLIQDYNIHHTYLDQLLRDPATTIERMPVIRACDPMPPIFTLNNPQIKTSYALRPGADGVIYKIHKLEDKTMKNIERIVELTKRVKEDKTRLTALEAMDPQRVGVLFWARSHNSEVRTFHEDDVELEAHLLKTYIGVLTQRIQAAEKLLGQIDDLITGGSEE